MTASLSHTTRVLLPAASSTVQSSIASATIEPFSSGRAAPRLLFDFAVMASLLKPSVLEEPVIDFGAGTGWISEFCCRMGLQVVSFDIHENLQACLENRVLVDRRIDGRLLSFAHGDGHCMPFESGVFGHLLCFDTLHHMRDYSRVFLEFFRILRKGGRGIFVEPGARHSSSPETIAFLKAQKNRDPNLIERDVVLEEIDKIARDAGFKKGLSIIPMPLPANFLEYSMDDWKQFRAGATLQRLKFTNQLSSINYYERVIFYVDKPE